MRTLLILTILNSFFVASCQSSQPARPPEFDKGFSLTKKTLTLEKVIANWDQSMDDLHKRDPAANLEWQEEIHRICIKQDNLCEFPAAKNSRKKDRFTKQELSEMREQVLSGDFEALKNYSIDASFKFFAKFKEPKLMDFADSLLHDLDCKTVEMKHALASTLEDSLPDVEVKDTVQALYEQNSECPMSRTATMSTYRAAMLRLVDQDCPKAIPLLEKVNSSTEDYLKPRSMYWNWRCQGESTALRDSFNNQLPYFSYHRILMNETSSPDEEGPELLDTTPTLTETAKNPYLNEVARLAEKLMASEMMPAARAVLEKVKVERIQEVEPEFQIYWAQLLNLNLSGVKKFQILAALINTYPQFRSRTVQNMLFPTAFFEHVEANSKKLDPWLVQSLIRQESAFDPRARSRVGATGLMQLMPSTARRISGKRGQLKDPLYNVHAGVLFLENLVNRFDGQVHFALAAYNAGPAKVEEWIKRYPTTDPMLFVDTIPYRETREYVAFILRNYHWYRSLNLEIQTAQSEPKTLLNRMAIPVDSF